MRNWRLDYQRGRRWLHRHQPVRALTCLERALLTIPTERRRQLTPCHSRRRELALLFYYFAIALRKTGLHNRSVASLVESTRLMKRGQIRRKLYAVTNRYGMAWYRIALENDRHAFYGIQLSRYLAEKKSHRLGTRAEIDMIAELIDEYWEYISRVFPIHGLSTDQKRELFNEVKLVFPQNEPPATKGEEVAVDFVHGKRLTPDDTCACGSGLPFKLCHGRIPGVDELLIGQF